MSDQPRCRAHNKDGGPCGAMPQTHTPFCQWHDPERVEERAEWNRKGGKATSTEAKARRTLKAGVLTAEDLRARLGVVFVDVVEGRTEPAVGTAAATIARALLDVARVADVEEQVAQIRRDMAAFAERRGAAG